jgi:hypothetical protein
LERNGPAACRTDQCLECPRQVPALTPPLPCLRLPRTKPTPAQGLCRCVAHLQFALFRVRRAGCLARRNHRREARWV